MGRSPEFNVARGAALWAAAAVIYLAAEAVVAASCPGYSYARDYIGDLALPSGAVVRGHLVFSPRAALMRAAFYLQGILFSVAMSADRPGHRRGRAFLGAVAVNTVGNAVIGAVHSGPVHVVGARVSELTGQSAQRWRSSVCRASPCWRSSRRRDNPTCCRTVCGSEAASTQSRCGSC